MPRGTEHTPIVTHTQSRKLIEAGDLMAFKAYCRPGILFAFKSDWALEPTIRQVKSLPCSGRFVILAHPYDVRRESILDWPKPRAIRQTEPGCFEVANYWNREHPLVFDFRAEVVNATPDRRK